jgi:hypothetical protein
VRDIDLAYLGQKSVVADESRFAKRDLDDRLQTSDFRLQTTAVHLIEEMK